MGGGGGRGGGEGCTVTCQTAQGPRQRLRRRLRRGCLGGSSGVGVAGGGWWPLRQEGQWPLPGPWAAAAVARCCRHCRGRGRRRCRRRCGNGGSRGWEWIAVNVVAPPLRRPPLCSPAHPLPGVQSAVNGGGEGLVMGGCHAADCAGRRSTTRTWPARHRSACPPPAQVAACRRHPTARKRLPPSPLPLPAPPFPSLPTPSHPAAPTLSLALPTGDRERGGALASLPPPPTHGHTPAHRGRGRRGRASWLASRRGRRGHLRMARTRLAPPRAGGRVDGSPSRHAGAAPAATTTAIATATTTATACVGE